jgi:hypothetical protein
MDNYLKTCTRCAAVGNLELFAKDARKKDGRSGTCKKCQYLLTKDWRKRNPIAANKLQVEWGANNINKSRAIRLKGANTYRSNPLNKIACSVRGRTRQGLRAAIINKKYKTIEMLGIDFINYAKYLSNKFVNGMTLENYGSVWHIDHIIPLASAKSEQELIKLLHYTNTQPLFAKDNLSKGAKLDW